MTAAWVSVDDLKVPSRVLATTDALFLDFDGPVCAVFSNFPAREVADLLRGVLAGGGHTGLPDRVAASEDPFEVLEHAASLGAEANRHTEAALRAHEVEAVAVPAVRCTLVGDSLTDLQAARRARSRAIGYANKAGKSELFAAEHPGAITTSMTHLSRALLL